MAVETSVSLKVVGCFEASFTSGKGGGGGGGG